MKTVSPIHTALKALRACLIINVADRVAYPEPDFVVLRRSVRVYTTEEQDESRPGYAKQR